MTDIESKLLYHKITNTSVDFLELSKIWRTKLAEQLNLIENNNGELEAFVSYAIAFPNEFIALVDTYDVRRSGLLNFCAVSMALNDLEYKAVGIRIDSGDLAYLSQCAYALFTKIANTYNIPWFQKLMIMVSNDINEEIIISLSDQSNEIKAFGIGTHLVTCQKQPALGCVYKMVEVNNSATMKLSQDLEKMNIPGKKEIFRLYNSEGFALIDLLQKADEKWPEVGQKVLCRHPFDRSKRCYVVPRKVEKLLNIYWGKGNIVKPLPTLAEIRKNVNDSLLTIRPDIKRYLNPTPYKIGVSETMYNFIQNLWLEITPIAELV